MHQRKVVVGNMSKLLSEWESQGQTFRAYKYKVGGHNKIGIYQKGKSGSETNFKATRKNTNNIENAKSRMREKYKDVDRREPPKPPPEKKKIYRSVLVIGYNDMGVVPFEYRVWVHTNEPNITPGDLEKWSDAIQNLYPLNNNKGNSEDFMTLLRTELNEEIDENEMSPNETLNKWWGYVVFYTKVPKAEYFAEQSGQGFKKTGRFSEPKV